MILNYKKIILSLLVLVFGVFPLIGQEEEIQEEIEDNYDYFFEQIIEATLEDYYKDYSESRKQTDSIINSFGLDDDEVPVFTDEEYCERLSTINEISPFKLDCNEHALKTIKFFAEKRRSFTSIVLGRSELYFNMFEEKLAKHGLPLELKYLAVIESGLRPTVKSRAGALGLWQFMYRTGKIYGLEQNSYIDERMDPELATEAACQYLKKLHSLYDDWNMALAAYNAGPGNVNKAIRRSGGKTTYWEIRRFLPKETQGYVPNFIAMAYMCKYHAEHNIRPREPKFLDFEVDTVCLSKGLHMATIDSVIGWETEDIKVLNPIFKTSYIPFTEEHKCINIPAKMIDKWIALEDSIYTLDSLIYTTPSFESNLVAKTTNNTNSSNVIHHKVAKGQTLGYIAKRYGTTVNNLMNWNNLSSTNLSIGQNIKIHSKTLANNHSTKTQSSSNANNSSNDAATHIVSQGDSLWAIAQRNSTTVAELQRLNPNVNSQGLKVGQKIRVR